ncbi:MAG: hypothetical protein HF314_01905 [Ignavibacteria bacterium]|jgi:photosystem II stability/assembly factor-like uncharacterized protein|nr:hypothetical protein [Ignavibacteria bacterium]MCU7501798.1 hypothetical protein [Ignavibacteria bacterium]MCU7518281.1 hypothetical protein [Ignavibacteria bacterium]
MKIKNLFPIVLTLVLFLNAKGFAQLSPESYEISSRAKLQKTESVKKTTSITPLSNSINDILTVGDTLWLGTSRGLSRSTDKGATWTNYYGTEAFGSESISAIAYLNGVVWVSTAHSVEKDGQSLSEGGGLRYSTDNGNSWTVIPQPIDAPDDSVVVYGINRLRALPVTVAVNNLSYDIALTSSPSTVWISSYAGGLRKSTDMGKTWQRVVLPPDRLDSIRPTDTLNFSLQPVAGKFGSESNLNHRVFSVIAAGSDTLYVGTAGGINRSTDGGVSWTKFTHQNQNSPISGNFVVALGSNGKTHSVWAATWKAEEASEYYAVSYSTDAGNSWKTALQDEKVHNFGFKGPEVIAASDNGAYRAAYPWNQWLTPGTIVDKESNISLQPTAFYAAASQGDLVWLGTENGLASINETGSMWQGDWKLFYATQPLASADETYAFPNPFSPDVERLTIKYSTGGTRTNVTIRIFDFGMNLVKTVIQNAERGSSLHAVEGQSGLINGSIDYWDGRDENGKIVPNGVYFYRIDKGSGDPVYGKVIVLL